jgi:hypothetical protein
MSEIRIVQYFELLAFTGNLATARSLADANRTDTITLASTTQNTVYHRYQNYFINETVKWPNTVAGSFYAFVPFKAEGTLSSLGGDNAPVQVLFPNVEVAIRLVEQGNGNRLSRLKMTTVWMNAALAPIKVYEERYIGIGAGLSETTIELRFRSAMDSVGSQFPARKFSRSLVGLLPLNADISLR